MTDALRIDPDTLRLTQRWTVLTLALAAGAAIVPVITTRGSLSSLALGIVAVGGFWAACRRHATLHLPLVAGLLATLVPDDALGPRWLPALLAGPALYAACECATVARRLLTEAPVTETAADERVVARSVGIAAAAAVVVALLGLLERFQLRVLGVALVIAIAVIAIVLTGARWLIDDSTPTTPGDD